MAATGAARSSTSPHLPPASMPATSAVTAKASRENFPVASLLLPRHYRRALLGIYGFARLTDDIGDEATGNREALLDWLEDDVGRMYSDRPIHPLLRRLQPAVERYDLPRDAFTRLIRANRQDQTVTRYRTYSDLAAYCELSANPVGELVLNVFAAATPRNIRFSDAVCTGLQLAEHWQDVGEDYARGRVYVPQEDLEAFGVPEDELAAEQPSEALKRLMAFEVARARGLLEQGGTLVRELSGWARLAVAGYVGGGKAALDAIEASGYRVLGDPPRPTGAGKAAAAVRELKAAAG
jgi:squalene synthase HpnC